MPDVVVAGAGAAGLVAALAAADRGRRVLLLERDATTPSTLSLSGGLIAAAGTRWQREPDSPARFAADIRAKSGTGMDPVLLDAVTRGAAEALTFLNAVLPLHLHTASRWPGHSAMRLHATPAESGAELQALLRQAVSRHRGIEFRDGAAVTALLPGVSGVMADGRAIEAAAVILATGGFGGAPDLIARFCPEAAGAVHVGGRHSDGAALRWAEALGAGLGCMDSWQGQPHVSPHLLGAERPRFGGALPALGAILVNRLGRRFVAEDMGPSELTAHLLAQPGGVAVEIWSGAAHQAALGGGPFRRAVELGAVAACEDLAALAGRFRLPPAALAETLAELRREPDRFGRRAWGHPLAPPFFAAEVTGALAHTQGGVLVDGAGRVLRRDGSVIPRLFAAGGVACGVSGHGAAGYVPGNGLAQSFALGFRAGRAA
jgi:fumarate reductase flavoprotein subunit